MDPLEDIENQFLKEINIVNQNIKGLTTDQIIGVFCYNVRNQLFLNFNYIKLLSSLDKKAIIEIIRKNIIEVLGRGHEKAVIHVCLKSMSITQIDKYLSLFKEAITIFRIEFPDRLERCYLYHCSSIFSYLYTLISRLLEKETSSRIMLYKKDS